MGQLFSNLSSKTEDNSTNNNNTNNNNSNNCPACPECKCASPDYNTDCPKYGYKKPEDIITSETLNSAFNTFMQTISLTTSTEQDKRNMYDLLFEYKPFKVHTSSTPTVDDIIEDVLYSCVSFCSKAIPSGVGTLMDKYLWNAATTFNNDNSCKVGDNSSNDSKILNICNTVYTLMQGVYAFTVSGILYTYYTDFTKSANDTDKLFKTWTMDGTRQSQEKYEKVLNDNVKPIVNGLWKRLFISFWFPKILDVPDTLIGKKVRTNILQYASSYEASPELTESNLKAIFTLVMFYDILQSGITDFEKLNSCSPCFIHKYLKEKVKAYDKLKETTRAALESSLGLIVSNTNDWEYTSVDPTKAKDMMIKVCEEKFKDVYEKSSTNKELPKVITFDKATFKPIGLDACKGSSYSVLTLVLVIILVVAVVWVLRSMIINSPNVAKERDLWGRTLYNV